MLSYTDLTVPSGFVEIDTAAGVAALERRLSYRQDSRKGLDRTCERLVEELQQITGAQRDPATGLYRQTVIGPNLVYKVPNPDHAEAYGGIHCSLYEVRCYETGGWTSRQGARFPVVPCRIAWHESGLPVVVMERVEIHAEEDDVDGFPQWAGVIDKNQVGWSASMGAWAIYDAGCVEGSIEPPFEALRALGGIVMHEQLAA